ncbi:Mobile element protein [Thermodesulfovibrio sp. N1]|uniref:transposase n=1 Tax=Thermodesulfovibrio sp. N1 TaxID=1871110 RepID=UPI000855E4DA|nr:transposase [Thermodesulfovibrio sp. N1]ODA44656.1 Mobile element protein [Thermodesulfovibrio sp. N1]
MNELMKKEREIYLRESIDNKANGYYERQLACFLGNLGISVPRDRKSEFRQAILPAEWQKANESFQEFILNLVSYSPNKIKALLQSMNLPYSAEQIEEIKELPSDMFALFIDAYHTQIKDEEVSGIEKNKWKKSIPLVKLALYELKQMFVKKFYGQTQFS